MLAVCHSAREALDIGQQATVLEAGSQLWAFLNTNLVRKATNSSLLQRTNEILREEYGTEISLRQVSHF